MVPPAPQPSPEPPRNRRAVLLAVFLVALAARAPMLLDRGGWGSEEVLIAEQIAAGNGFQGPSLYGDQVRPTSQKAPATSYLLALALILGNGAPHFAFIVMQAIAGALLCWWLVRLGEETLGARTGLLAGLLAALFVPHIWWMRHFGEQIFAAAAMVGSLLLFYRAERSDRASDAALWGVSLGLGGYFAADVLLAAPLLALWLAWRRRRRGLGPAVSRPVIAALVAFAVLAPWTARNWSVHHRFVLVRTGFGTALWWGNNPDATGTDWFLVDDREGGRRRVSGRYAMPPELYARLATMPEVEQERLLTDVALDWMEENPAAAAQLWLRKLYYFWWFSALNDRDPVPMLREIAWGGVLLFFALGAVAGLREHRALLVPLLFPIATSTLLHATTVVSQNWRMRIPIEPIVLLFAAHGVRVALAAARRPRAPGPEAG